MADAPIKGADELEVLTAKTARANSILGVMWDVLSATFKQMSLREWFRFNTTAGWQWISADYDAAPGDTVDVDPEVAAEIEILLDPDPQEGDRYLVKCYAANTARVNPNGATFAGGFDGNFICDDAGSYEFVYFGDEYLVLMT